MSIWAGKVEDGKGVTAGQEAGAGSAITGVNKGAGKTQKARG